MSASWGNKIRYTLFGESHGTAIGIVIDGLPPGITIDWKEIHREMARRAPGKLLTTSRQEPDQVEIQSGTYHDQTTGAPLCALIVNKNQRSSDYEQTPLAFRPSHADYGGWIKFSGQNDPRGGGSFSGRLTAPLVFAGALIKSLLRAQGIHLAAHLEQIGSKRDRKFQECDFNQNTFQRLTNSDFPVLDSTKQKAIISEIEDAASQGDSVGGIIEAAAIGLPPGKGELFFGSLESRLSQLLFSIPAVKGVEFGSGFSLAALRGSQANDLWTASDGPIRTKTNHNGGILGGLTTGMPMICRVAVKPTSSIFIPQETVTSHGKPCTLTLTGRHDPCIAVRALPVVESAISLALWDIL